MADLSADIAIVGAGISGIILAIKLKQAGINNFVVYERDVDVAGTWLTNAYPGCRSDVPAHWYSLSTHLNPNWTVTHPPQTELLAYWMKVVELENIRPHIRFQTALVSAKWNPSAAQYDLVLTTGTDVNTDVGPFAPRVKRPTFEATARIVVSGIGGFSVPLIPNLPGMPAHLASKRKASQTTGIVDGGSDSGVDVSEDFEGLVVHAARYPRGGLDLKGKSVAVIGNGCSGTQIVPALSEEPTTTVYSFFRSGQWYLPNEIPVISDTRKQRYAKYPFLLRLHRFRVYLAMDPSFYFIFVKKRKWIRESAEKKVRRYIRKVAPKECSAVLTPDFPLGAKRVVRDIDFLKSLNRPNVKPVTTGIKKLTRNAIITNDGQTLPVSTIVLATGFDVMAGNINIVGRNGLPLTDVISQEHGETGYHGMAQPGYPNFFMMMGQNTAPTHASVIFQLEVQAEYITQCYQMMQSESIKVLEVKPEAQTEYNKWISKKLEATVCSESNGFYHLGNKKGARIVANWPSPVALYWFQNAIPRWKDWIGAENAAKTQYGWWTLRTIYRVVSSFFFTSVKVVTM